MRVIVDAGTLSLHGAPPRSGVIVDTLRSREDPVEVVGDKSVIGKVVHTDEELVIVLGDKADIDNEARLRIQSRDTTNIVCGPDSSPLGYRHRSG